MSRIQSTLLLWQLRTPTRNLANRVTLIAFAHGCLVLSQPVRLMKIRYLLSAENLPQLLTAGRRDGAHYN